MEAGVRQGCPLSPLLFAVCADLLLAKVADKLKGATIRAYADDTAIVIEDMERDLPILQEIFNEYENKSGLALNLKKPVIIPLNVEGIPSNQEKVSRWCPQWKEVIISEEGTYLGFQIGPKAHDTSWKKPLRKYEKACKL